MLGAGHAYIKPAEGAVGGFSPHVFDACVDRWGQQVDRFVVGWPTNWDDSPTHGTPHAAKAIQLLQKNFPSIPVEKIDERYTSKMAKDALLEMGLKKKDRRDKKLVDEVAAVILLQEYLRSVQGS